MDGLLFSSDAHVLGVMNQVLRKFSIQTEICLEYGSALDGVAHRRLDAIVVDWEGTDPTKVVRSARNHLQTKTPP